MRLLTALCALFCLCFAAPARALTITIDPGQYTGRYYIPGVTGCCLSGVQSVPLPGAGTYALDNSSTIAGSSFLFTVDVGGNVSVDSPAATASGGTLLLNAVTISVKAQAYTGRYLIASYYPNQYSGDQTFTLIPGLTYSLDDGAEIAGSAFAFSLDATGNISADAPAVTVSGTTMSFRAVPIGINPQAYAGTYFLSPFFAVPFAGAQTVNVLPGLSYQFDDGAELGNSFFVFAVDALGGVSTESPAASGSGNTLTLANVFVHVDSGCIGTYSITGYPGLQGPADIVLIPTLAVAVTTPGESSVVVIPAGTFTISTDCVTLTSSTYSAAIQQPIKADGSSVFRANRGVVPVKFTLTNNGLPTCTLPSATISLFLTSGAGQGVVNQSDYIQPSDTGTAFRIDQAACQYVYNLGTSTLGTGQYVVRISISGVVIGSAPFGLQ